MEGVYFTKSFNVDKFSDANGQRFYRMMKSIHIPDRDSHVSTDPDGSVILLRALWLSLTVGAMLLFGLTMLYSTSSGTSGASLFIKQLVWSAVGIAAAVVVAVVGHRRLARFHWFFLLVAAGLLLVADFCFPAIKGAHRWIRVPGVGNIQPSEFAKIALLLFLAKYCSENRRYLDNLFKRKGPLPALGVTLVILGLIFAGKDWGTTFLLGTVAMIVLFVAGMRVRYLLAPFLLAPFLPLYLKTMDKERWSRLTSFLDPERFQDSDSYQLWHSLLALGSGGGLGLGFTESRMKAKYLPEAHTDFILSIVGEELGFTFMCLVVVFYALFVYFGTRVAVSARTKQGMLLAVGVTSLIGLQAFINIGVVSGALPTKGMPAPFISYGGSNLVSCLCGVGLLISVALEGAELDPLRELPLPKRLKRALLAFDA